MYCVAVLHRKILIVRTTQSCFAREVEEQVSSYIKDYELLLTKEHAAFYQQVEWREVVKKGHNE
jgi:hypothetical protein